MLTKKFEKGDVNLLIFFLVSVLFVFGMATLWSKNWFIDDDMSYASVFLTKAALDKKIDQSRNKQQENVNESLKIYDDQKNNNSLKK